MSKKRKTVVAVLAVIALVSAGIAGWITLERNQNHDIYEDLPSKSSESSVSSEESKEPYVSPIDFDAYWAINEDVIATIEIPGLDIDYPIMQSTLQNDYYLDRTIDGKVGYPGSIYVRLEAKKDFSRFNTLIYGHDMKNGTMFGNLKKYREPGFIDEHREIKIYTPDAEYTYTIFAAVVYSDVLIPSKYKDDVREDREAFIKSLSETKNFNSIVLDDVEVNADSHLITLSTCIGNMKQNRYLIVAVRNDEEEN